MNNYKDRERLKVLLMVQYPSNYKKEILEIVPELLVCKDKEQENPAHHLDVLSHIFKVVDGVEAKLTLRLAALFHDIGKPYAFNKVDGIGHFWGHEEKSEILAGLILNRLCFPISVVNEVCLLIKYHDTKIEVTEQGVKAMICELYDTTTFASLMKLKFADLYGHSEKQILKVEPILLEIQEIYDNMCL